MWHFDNNAVYAIDQHNIVFQYVKHCISKGVTIPNVRLYVTTFKSITLNVYKYALQAMMNTTLS